MLSLSLLECWPLHVFFCVSTVNIYIGTNNIVTTMTEATMTGTAETAVLAGKESKSNGHCVPRAAAAAATYDAMIPSELILRQTKL